MRDRRIPLNSGDRRRPLLSRLKLNDGPTPEIPEMTQLDFDDWPSLTVVERPSTVLPFASSKTSKESGDAAKYKKRYGLTPYPAQSGAGTRAYMRRIRSRNLQLF